jgi:hypothetical protein
MLRLQKEQACVEPLHSSCLADFWQTRDGLAGTWVSLSASVALAYTVAWAHTSAK